MDKDRNKKFKKKGNEYGKDLKSYYIGGLLLVVVIIIVLIFQFMK